MISLCWNSKVKSFDQCRVRFFMYSIPQHMKENTIGPSHGFFLDKRLFGAASLRQVRDGGSSPRRSRALLASVATGALSPAAWFLSWFASLETLYYFAMFWLLQRRLSEESKVSSFHGMRNLQISQSWEWYLADYWTCWLIFSLIAD
jgi:hypothetical protein